MPDEPDYSTLPLMERLVHSVWKVRAEAYAQLEQELSGAGPEVASEYASLVPKFVIDSNVMAQGKGLAAATRFVDQGGRQVKAVAKDVAAGVVSKCFNSSKAATIASATELCLLLIEVTESSEVVVEALVAGLTNKQPKIVCASATAIKDAILAFGVPAISAKPIIKALPGLLGHANTKARDQAKAIAIVLHSLIGAPVEAKLQGIKPVLLKELQASWKAAGDKPAPTRRFRSLQAASLEPKAGAETGAGASADTGANEPEPTMDAYDLSDPVEVKIPPSFETEIKEAKWSIRKAALEGLFKALNKPKIVPSDFGDVVRSLISVVAKDTNVLNVALAANCLGALSRGLRSEFAQHTIRTADALLGKFKEKKQNVITALHGALDGALPTMPLEKLAETIVEALKSKNPSVKQESCTALAKLVSSQTSAPSKAVLKALCPVVVERSSEALPGLRAAAMDVLAAMLRQAGDKAMAAYFKGLDASKVAKIRDLSENGPAEARAPTLSKASRAASTKPARPSTATAGRSVRKPSKATAPKRTSPAASLSKTKSAALSTTASSATFPDMSLEEANSVVQITEATVTLLASKVWKERLEGAQTLKTMVEQMASVSDREAMALFKLAQGATKQWKESNFQVFNAILTTLMTTATKCTALPDRCAHVCVGGAVSKLGDAKIREMASKILNVLSECWSLNEVSLLACKSAEGQPNPKVLAGTLQWAAESLDAFGLRIALKPHVAFAKRALGATNPSVRTAAIDYVGALRVHAGASVEAAFQGQPQHIAALISAKFASAEGTTPSAPTRVERSAQQTSPTAGAAEADSADDAGSAADPAAPDPEDLIDRVDVLSFIKGDTIAEISDANWKVRAAALNTVQSVMNSKSYIQPSLGDLGSALAGRLKDSNKNLVISTLGILGTIAKAVGKQMKRNVSIFLPGIYEALADGKEAVRAAAIKAMDAFYGQVQLAPFVEADLIATALGSGKPYEQSELLQWLVRALEQGADASLKTVIKPLVNCLGDRSKDVRKSAGELLPHVVANVGADKMKKACKALTGSVQTQIMEAISAAQVQRPKKPAAAEPVKSKTTVSKTGSTKSFGSTTRRSTKTKALSSTAPREAASGAPLLSNPNGRSRRIKDKGLKWNFSNPRQEFVTQLQDQCKGSIGADLLGMLFSTDFKAHGKALDMLIEAVHCEPGESAPYAAEAIASIDLLLKWTTLRFFETNPTVSLKVMQFLQELFAMVAAEGAELSDGDAGAFLPYLINQSGAKLESVRKATHTILRAICKTYPASKVFGFLLEGLKSKNSKQRAECLNEISYLIERHGMSVCQIGAAKSMKAIAHQINDRDNTVRSAALDAVVTVYNFMGEDVHQLMGNIGDKNISLVTERIKRSGKHGAVAAEPVPSSKVVGRASTGNRTTVNRRKSSKPPSSRAVKRASDVATSSVPQEFTLDLQGINAAPVVALDALGLAPTEFEDMDGGGDTSAGAQPIAAAETVPVTADALANGPVGAIVAGISVKVPDDAVVALKVAEDRFKRNPDEWFVVADRALEACTAQLNLLFTVHFASSDEVVLGQSVRLCKHLLGFVLSMFKLEPFPARASRGALEKIVVALLTYVQSPKLDGLGEGNQVTRAINCIILKILQSVPPNLALTMLLTIFEGCLDGNENADSKLIQLVQRCLWKLVRALPETIGRVNVANVLADMEHLFQTLGIEAATATSDVTAIRTVRPVVQALVRLNGRSVAVEMDAAGLSYDTAVGAMVLKALADEGQAIPQPAISSQPQSIVDGLTPVGAPSAAASPALSEEEQEDRLVEIFAMITSKEETKQGMVELYDFRAQYPDADVKKFMDTTSTFFQSHITRSLDGIERQRSSESSSAAKMATSSAAAATGKPQPQSAASYMDRLRSLTSNTKAPILDAGARDPLTTIQQCSSPQKTFDPAATLPSVNRSPPRRTSPKKGEATQLNSLKARLARFKAK